MRDPDYAKDEAFDAEIERLIDGLLTDIQSGNDKVRIEAENVICGGVLSESEQKVMAYYLSQPTVTSAEGIAGLYRMASERNCYEWAVGIIKGYHRG